MNWKEHTKTGKEINSPTRGFRDKDLEEMGLSHVKGALFFNRYKHDQEIPDVETGVLDNMAVGNYPDCTTIPFSKEKLSEVVEEQLSAVGDYLFIPSFKQETDYETRERLAFAGWAKRLTDKEVVFEIPYKSTVPTSYLLEKRSNFDRLAIYYGSHWIGIPAFEKIAVRIKEIRTQSNIPVKLTGVPLMFKDSQGQFQLMPIWPLVADAWVKCWRKAGSKDSEIKIVDMKDRKNKARDGWIRAGHLPNEVIGGVNRTVYDLFAEDARGEDSREQYAPRSAHSTSYQNVSDVKK